MNPGEDITFHAIATVDPSVEDQTITYTWEEVSTYDEVGTGETYTIHDVQKGYYLICKAEDAYGNSEYMYFSVGIKNDWTVELYSGDEFLTSTWSSNGNKTVPYNGSLTLTAKVRMRLRKRTSATAGNRVRAMISFREKATRRR